MGYAIKVRNITAALYFDLGYMAGQRSDLVTLGNEVTDKQKAEKKVSVSRKTLMRWNRERSFLTEAIVNQFIAGKTDEALGYATISGLLRFARESLRSEDDEDAEEEEQRKSGRYKVIYADPPWKYTEQGLTGVSNKDGYRNRVGAETLFFCLQPTAIYRRNESSRDASFIASSPLVVL